MIYDDHKVRIVSIDPGSQLAGITLWEFDPEDMELAIVDCFTVDLKRYEKSETRDLDKIELRLLGLRKCLKGYFKRFPPNAVVTESNFLMKKKVSGYRGLLLTQAAIRDAMYSECPTIELDIMHVIRAKEFMQAKSNSKEDVHKKVGCIEGVKYPEGFDVNAVGPDALDSIAIGYCYIKTHWEQLERLHWLFLEDNK